MPCVSSLAENINVQNNWLSHFFGFMGVGILSFAVDAGTLSLLHGLAGCPLPVAVTVAYVLSFGVNFTLNRVGVFRADGGPAGQVGRYAVLCLVNYLATLVLVTGLTAVGTHYLVAKTVATGLLVIVNYLVCRAWVFSAGS